MRGGGVGPLTNRPLRLLKIWFVNKEQQFAYKYSDNFRKKEKKRKYITYSGFLSDFSSGFLSAFCPLEEGTSLDDDGLFILRRESEELAAGLGALESVVYVVVLVIRVWWNKLFIKYECGMRKKPTPLEERCGMRKGEKKAV